MEIRLGQPARLQKTRRGILQVYLFFEKPNVLFLWAHCMCCNSVLVWRVWYLQRWSELGSNKSVNVFGRRGWWITYSTQFLSSSLTITCLNSRITDYHQCPHIRHNALNPGTALIQTTDLINNEWYYMTFYGWRCFLKPPLNSTVKKKSWSFPSPEAVKRWSGKVGYPHLVHKI